MARGATCSRLSSIEPTRFGCITRDFCGTSSGWLGGLDWLERHEGKGHDCSYWRRGYGRRSYGRRSYRRKSYGRRSYRRKSYGRNRGSRFREWLFWRLPTLRSARACDGGNHERHFVAWRFYCLWRHFFSIFGLLPSCFATSGADGFASSACYDA